MWLGVEYIVCGRSTRCLGTDYIIYTSYTCSSTLRTCISIFCSCSYPSFVRQTRVRLTNELVEPRTGRILLSAPPCKMKRTSLQPSSIRPNHPSWACGEKMDLTEPAPIGADTRKLARDWLIGVLFAALVNNLMDYR